MGFVVWSPKPKSGNTGPLSITMAMGKVYTIGLKQADKCMKLAATAYNFKKWLKFTEKRAKSAAGILPSFITAVQEAIRSLLRTLGQDTGQVRSSLAG